MLIETAFTVIIVFLAIVFHEVAHGWVAHQLGDPTAKLAGRLTLNPFKHIDPFGTIILPGILLGMRLLGMPTIVLGWAKPVPVNFSNLGHPKRDMVLVALAGPAVNILFAFVLSRLLDLPALLDYRGMIESGIFINLILASFNMVPIPPLDGSRLVAGLLPDRLAFQYMKLEPYGILIVFILLYAGLFQKMVIPIVGILATVLGVKLS